MVKLRNMRSCIFIVMLQLPEEDPQNSPESLVAGYNLGQNKMEQEIRIPPESRMKPREAQNRLFCHLSLILGER